MNKIIIVISLIISSGFLSQTTYKKYIDSAANCYSENPKLALAILDKIPRPVDESVKDNLAEYYQVRAIISNILNDRSMAFYNYFLALKYAEKEKKYGIAGMVCVELYSDIYWDSQDKVLAKKYLELAMVYYTKDNNVIKLLEVSQLYAYEKYVNKDYEGCRRMLLKDFADYRKYSKKDSYSLVFGLAMLISCELQLGNYNNAYKHYYEFKRLRNAPNPNIKNNVFESFDVGLHTLFAQMHCKNNELDSAFIYLQKVPRDGRDVNFVYLQRYFSIYTELYTKKGDLKMTAQYIDSLSILQRNQLKKNLNASYAINKALKEHDDLKTKDREKRYLFYLLIVLISSLFIFLVIVYIKRKRKIAKEQESSSRAGLEESNLHLTVKISEVESYLINLRQEIKEISSIVCREEQNLAIQAFYRKLNVDSSQILTNQAEQLALINQIKQDFTDTLRANFPSLDNQDLIICHYVYSGLMNKEIAVFLNTSVRAVEGKRYRISKKMGLLDQNVKLVDFLKAFFDESN